MKDTIYTIPLTDAFNTEDECPFCYIHRKLEQDTIAFTLGASYMEEDFRAQTDQLGFCSEHYKKLYDYGNKLGIALILHTHYQSLEKQLSKALGENSLPSLSFVQKLRKSSSEGTNPASDILHKRMDTCFICDRIDKDMERYAKTFFYLISTNSDFKKMFTHSKGFCLPHFTFLVELAPLYLDTATKDFFYKESRKLLLESLKRIEGDISWFIDKYDYRNNDAPWKNSKDAIPRGIQKLAGIYPQDEPFKETK